MDAARLSTAIDALLGKRPRVGIPEVLGCLLMASTDILRIEKSIGNRNFLRRVEPLESRALDLLTWPASRKGPAGQAVVQNDKWAVILDDGRIARAPLLEVLALPGVVAHRLPAEFLSGEPPRAAPPPAPWANSGLLLGRESA